MCVKKCSSVLLGPSTNTQGTQKDRQSRNSTQDLRQLFKEKATRGIRNHAARTLGVMLYQATQAP